MLSSNHHLSLYTKFVTVLNKEDWQSMKSNYGPPQRRPIDQSKATCLSVILRGIKTVKISLWTKDNFYWMDQKDI